MDAALESYATPDDALWVRTMGGLARSTHGGASWNTVDLPPLPYSEDLFDIHYEVSLTSTKSFSAVRAKAAGP